MPARRSSGPSRKSRWTSSTTSSWSTTPARDETAKVAAKLGIHVVIHARNGGYGANQKTCYTAALARGADIVVMLHPDYQYTPKLITAMAAHDRVGPL